MQSSFAFLALLGAATALPGIRPDGYGYAGSNSTTSSSTSLSTSTSSSQTSSTSASTWGPIYPGTSSLNSTSSHTIFHPYPTGGAPWYPHPTGGIIHHPRPHPTGSDHGHQTATVSTTTATQPISVSTVIGSSYITTTQTIPITSTVTTHVPCSTEVSSNGQIWWSTYLSASYYATSYLTTTTIVQPAPTPIAAPYPPHCPPQGTVTKTITEYIGYPSPQPQLPGQSLTTKTITLTLEHDYTTTVTVAYPVPTTTVITKPHHPYPPYPITSGTSEHGGRPTGGFPHPSVYTPVPSGYTHSKWTRN